MEFPLIYTIRFRSRPEPEGTLTTHTTRLAAVAETILTRYRQNPRLPFAFSPAEWVGNDSPLQTEFAPGGFPWIELQKEEEK
jgi:hypothetical protein